MHLVARFHQIYFTKLDRSTFLSEKKVLEVEPSPHSQWLFRTATSLRCTLPLVQNGHEFVVHRGTLEMLDARTKHTVPIYARKRNSSVAE